MAAITLKFENMLSEDSLESLFDTLASVLPEDLYTESTTVSSDGVETDYNLIQYESHGYHCYEMPVTRPLTVQEGKTLHNVFDSAIQGDYIIEMTGDGKEIQKKYEFTGFDGAIQEGNLD